MHVLLKGVKCSFEAFVRKLWEVPPSICWISWFCDPITKTDLGNLRIGIGVLLVYGGI